MEIRRDKTFGLKWAELTSIVQPRTFESVEEAKSAVDHMPLVAAGYASYQFWPVGPLVPLGRLIQGK